MRYIINVRLVNVKCDHWSLNYYPILSQTKRKKYSTPRRDTFNRNFFTIVIADVLVHVIAKSAIHQGINGSRDRYRRFSIRYFGMLKQEQAAVTREIHFRDILQRPVEASKYFGNEIASSPGIPLLCFYHCCVWYEWTRCSPVNQMARR